MTEWIKCSDRQPSKFNYYLTYNENHNFVSKYAAMRILKYRPKEKVWWWYYGMNNGEIIDVTHWMSLPNPPEVKDD